MGLSAKELKDRFVGAVFDSVEVPAEAEDMVNQALACGETDPRYTDPSHPEFQAPMNFATRYHGARMLPEDFPEIDRRTMIDAGKAVEWKAPIRPGDTITAKSHLHDIYDKTGRSGTMLFLVQRMEFTNQRDELVSIVDWRLIVRGGLS